MTDSLQLLIQRRASVAADAEKFLNQYNKSVIELKALDNELIPRLSKMLDALYGTTGLSDSQPSLPLGKPYKTDGDLIRRKSLLEILEPLAIESLKKHGQLTTRQLFESVNGQELKIGGKNPITNMGAHLHRSNLVKNEGGWWRIVSEEQKANALATEGGGEHAPQI